jgi:ABC-type multidrug transport system fused ATPase/permease subunit
MPSVLGDAGAARQRYQTELDSIQRERAKLESVDHRFTAVRVALFFLALTAWIFAYFSEAGLWGNIIGSVAFVSFLIVVVVNEPIREKIDQLKRSRAVFQRLIARLERDWDKLATKKLTASLAAVELSEHQRDVADDLDLLGKVSLFHLISMAATMTGIRTLAGWLAGSADAAVATERAAAVTALAPLRDERLRFYALAREVGESSGDPDHFVQWASGQPWLASRRWLLVWANLSALISIALLVVFALGVAGLLPSPAAKYSGLGLVALIFGNFLLSGVMLGPAHQIFSIAMSNRQAVSNYQELFSAARSLTSIQSAASDGCLARIHAAILEDDHSALVGMRELQKIASAGSMRQSAATFLIYLPLQAFALWDVRVLHRLEAWQAKYRDAVGRWFDAFGDLEALMSIAALHDEYPSWAMPVWNQANQILQAESIGHPLLDDHARVSNDVSIGPPGTILLITGSNMSGKSTMLRSIGLNVALAGIGAPVCAASLTLPSIHLATSIRVRDDLGEGVSFYMAELKRLKKVVDEAQKLADDPNRVLLFLLDEILQGTNSRERQIAVVQVLRHLIQTDTIGAISTHDLELADDPELQSLSTTVHFRETIRPDADGNEQMTFDYLMRQGVSPTTNALRLLEMVGLGHDDDP